MPLQRGGFKSANGKLLGRYGTISNFLDSPAAITRNSPMHGAHTTTLFPLFARIFDAHQGGIGILGRDLKRASTS